MKYGNIRDRSLAYNWNILFRIFHDDILPMVLHWLRFRHIFGKNYNISLSIKNMPIGIKGKNVLTSM